MRESGIESWKDLAELPSKFKDKPWIFRGVEDFRYELIPSVGREENWRKLADGTLGAYDFNLEVESFQRFKREASPHVAIKPESALEWLSIGPTPL